MEWNTQALSDTEHVLAYGSRYTWSELWKTSRLSCWKLFYIETSTSTNVLTKYNTKLLKLLGPVEKEPLSPSSPIDHILEPVAVSQINALLLLWLFSPNGSLFSLYPEEDRLFGLILHVLTPQQESSLRRPAGLTAASIPLICFSESTRPV